MISEYEVAKAIRLIYKATKEARCCDDCKVKPYCRENICWEISRKTKAMTDDEWEEYIKRLEEYDGI